MLKISPLDTLFFRDSKPFYMGAENYATGVFPPAPSVIYGALRSAYFAGHIAELPKATKPDDPTADLRLKGIFLQCGGETCFPLPLDCVRFKGEQRNRVVMLRLRENNIVSSCGFSYFLLPDGEVEVEPVAEGLLSDLFLQDYLNLSWKEFYFKLLTDWVKPEPKIGIARDRSKNSAAEGMIYRVEMKRLEDLSLLTDFTGLELPEQGLLKIGGEAKPAAYETIEPVRIQPPRIEGNYFKLYLATPAVFAKGWLPGWLDENTLQGEYQGMKLRLLTACVGRYQPIGGFDMKLKRPKPLRRMVPAGSVYYFELLQGEMSNVIRVFHDQNILGIDVRENSDEKQDYINYARQGFGLTYVGAVLT